MEDLRGFRIEANRRDAGQEFDHGYFRTEPRPDGAELQSDRARADDEHGLGHFGQGDALVAADHALAVKFEKGKFHRHAARGEDDVLRGDFLGARVADDFNRVGIDQLAEALEHLNLVLLHQVLHAAGQLVHDFTLALHHGGEVELDLAGDDAVRGETFLRKVEVLAGGKQRLAGNTADIETGAAEGLVFFDDGGLETELGGADGGNVAAGTATNDDELVIKVRHSKRLTQRGDHCHSGMAENFARGTLRFL